MDVKELRIGNLIYCKTDKGTKVGRIDSLQEISKIAFFVAVRTADGVDYKGKVNDEYNCIEPIPLTEEILLKNGFELTHKPLASGIRQHCVFRKEIDNTLIDIDDIQLLILDRNDEKIVHNAVINGDVKHIHEIQNAYYLATKKELQIKI